MPPTTEKMPRFVAGMSALETAEFDHDASRWADMTDTADGRSPRSRYLRWAAAKMRDLIDYCWEQELKPDDVWAELMEEE